MILSERLQANAAALRALSRRNAPVPPSMLRALAEDLVQDAREALILELRIHLGADAPDARDRT